MIAPRRWMSCAVLALALVVTLTPTSAQGQAGGLPAVQARVQALEQQVAALKAALEQVDTTPAGAVMFFNLSSCPGGWSELASAQGRYLVGLTTGGELAKEVGTALADQEDRPVGRHGHGVNDPGHSHSIQFQRDMAQFSSAGNRYLDEPSSPLTTLGTSSAQTGISVQSAGAVAGTNAPYLQLLVCVKE